MKLICGLGNPGREYEKHRHNVGFRVVEKMLERARGDLNQDKFDARVGQATLGSERVLFVLPQTFMNLSGKSVAGAARFYKIEPADILVIHDELDLPYARLQLKSGGGAGGHNGLRSIVEHLGTDGFARLRFGVGKPEGPNAKDRVVGHVLSGFRGEEEQTLEENLVRASEAAECWVTQGMGPAMNRYNKRS